MEHSPTTQPKTQAEVRKAEFLRHARAAEELAVLALADIDEALEENGAVIRPIVTL